MIVKNESVNLDRALKSVVDLVDELIIVDTGSTDNTREIAKKYGAKIYDFTWCDDFSAARNEAIKYSTGEWILWFDADEYLDEINQEKLRQLFSSLKNERVAYLFDQVSTAKDLPGEKVLSARASLFPNRPEIRWYYRVHEQIAKPLEESGGHSIKSDIQIFHSGYHERTDNRQKILRNIRLLHMENNENPNDPFILFHLGSSYDSLGRYAEALPYWPRTIQLFFPQNIRIAKCYFIWARELQLLGDIATANQICQEGLKRFPDDPELLLLQVELFGKLGHLESAEVILRKLISGPTSTGYNLNLSYSFECHTFRPYGYLGQLCAQTNRLDEAEQYFKKSLEYNPNFALSLEGLAQLYQQQGRNGEI